MHDAIYAAAVGRGTTRCIEAYIAVVGSSPATRLSTNDENETRYTPIRLRKECTSHHAHAYYI